MLTNYVSPDQTFIVCPEPGRCLWRWIHGLDKEPVVIQVPDFGNRFYVFALYDQRTDEIARIGKQYGTKPGFYMIVGRNWKGQVPKGVNAVIRSSTGLVFFVPRVFKDATPEDTAAVQPVINQVLMYPAQPVRREDEDEGLQQALRISRFPGAAQCAQGRTAGG